MACSDQRLEMGRVRLKVRMRMEVREQLDRPEQEGNQFPAHTRSTINATHAASTAKIRPRA